MLSDDELQEIESTAVDLVRGAGKLLLDYFDGPLTIDYKSANNRNPVTEADRASDAYLREEITRRYPDHGIVSEEAEPDADRTTDVVWVIDPLDGTSNFLNGIPIFCVLIAVLERGKPVAAAIFLPDIHRPEGRVLHARAGGGAFNEDVALSIEEEDENKRRMSTWPSYFLRMFAYRRHLRRRLGDVRSLGSSGYELALAGRGVLDYVVFNGLWAWDLAAGLLLVKEAGGIVMQYDRKTHSWEPFESFAPDGHNPALAELGKWRGVMVLGKANSVRFISSGLKVPTYRWRRFRVRLNGWLGRNGTPGGRTRTRGSAAAATRNQPQPPQSQGQGISRRE
jgi:myo-inositol-1(or 4)-monophosphatase